jgi:CubicO group peptidase (beta-lactamase class C family)
VSDLPNPLIPKPKRPNLQLFLPLNLLFHPSNRLKDSSDSLTTKVDGPCYSQDGITLQARQLTDPSMKKRRIIPLFAAAALIVISAGLYHASALISIGVAYKAKVLCSGVFVSMRSPESVVSSDLVVDDLAILRHIDVKIDHASQTSAASFLGLINQTAAFRPGLGCTLVFEGYKHRLPVASGAGVTAFDPNSAVWPEEPAAAKVMADVDQDRMQAALEWAFSEPDEEHLRRTRAVVVVHKGQIVAERYAPGFDKSTPLIGWSMTKSVINALVGILVEQGKLRLTDRVYMPEWKWVDSGRSAITLNNLLQMSSGLDFNEDDSDPLADVTHMLLREPDMATYAAGKKLVAEPGARWRYSSGTTNLLSRIIRWTVGDSDYFSFPRRALFVPLGMDSAVIEPDASGTFVGSSFMYATARDWAKFGQLYLQDGIWKGRRILPDAWVRYTTTPAAPAPEHEYGSHFWLKLPKEYASVGYSNRLPQDAFHAVGHEAQFVTVIPSRELVIVRLGLSRFSSAWQHDKFLSQVLDAIRN